MTTTTPRGADDVASGYATHEALNQPGALCGYNAYAEDTPLVEAVRVFGADWAGDALRRAGDGAARTAELQSRPRPVRVPEANCLGAAG